MAIESTLRNFLALENVNDRYIIDLNTDKKEFSYAELNEEIANLQRYFQSINIQKGDAISIILFNSIEYILSFLSINFSGNICLPLNTNLKKDEYIKYLVNNCKYIIIHDYDENNENYCNIRKKHSYYKNVCIAIEEMTEEYNIGLIKIKKHKTKPYFTYSYKSNLPNESGTAQQEQQTEDTLHSGDTRHAGVCLHLHTSGTTSKVKIVQLTNDNIKTTISNITNSYQISRNDNTVIVMPLYHVHGLIGVLLPIVYAKGNVLFQAGHSFGASEFWKNVIDYNITYFSAIPTILKILLIRYDNDYTVEGSNGIKEKIKHKLRFIRTSSSYLDEQMEKEIEEKFETTVLQAYGMTEACHQVSSNKFIVENVEGLTHPHVCKKYKSVGIPNVGVVIYNHERQKICRYNELGEICINGKNVMHGYKEGKDNDNIFVYVNTVEDRVNYMIGNKFLEIAENVPFFKTGDIGYVDEENFLFISGRIKDIINRGGEKILPNEIDDVLRGNPMVRDCLTFGSPDEVYGEVINTAVILRHPLVPPDTSDERAPGGSGGSSDICGNCGNCGNCSFCGNCDSGGSFDSSQDCDSNRGDDSSRDSSRDSDNGGNGEPRGPGEEAGFDVQTSVDLNLKHYWRAKELEKFMKSELADFKVPKKIYFVNNFLKTDTGKISRKKVSEGMEMLKKEEIKTFDVIALILKKYEVDCIYGLYGIPVNRVISSFLKNNIYYISFRNEINAALSCNYVNYFDLDWKKKKIGILLTCSGPAFVNTLSGMYNAKVNNFPMILISFENFINDELSLFEKYNNFQYFPQIDLLKSTKEICKETYHVHSLESFADQFHRCIHMSQISKCPVYLNTDYKVIGEKVTLEKAIETLEISDKFSRVYFQYTLSDMLPNEEEAVFIKTLHTFCNIYKSNKKGVIFLGINCNHGIKYVLKIAELLMLPIYTNTMARSFVKENYVYNANPCKSYLFENIDFCIAIGTVFNFYFNFGNFPNCKKKNMICIDINNDKYKEDEDNVQISNYFFFFDLYNILKKLYFHIKSSDIMMTNLDARQQWVENISQAKKKSIQKFCNQVHTNYLSDEKFTMEQTLIILRHILINYYFAKNDIDPSYRNYFINYLRMAKHKHVADFVDVGMPKEKANTQKKSQGGMSKSGTSELPRLNQTGETQMDALNMSDEEFPQVDCDLSESSCDMESAAEELAQGIYLGVSKRKKKKKCKYLSKEATKRVIITNEGSITLLLGIVYLPKFGPFNYVIPQANGMMGVSMNAAICAALENPKNIVFSILGDSSFGFTSNEIETMCRLKLQIVIIIFNNNGIYGDRDFKTKKKNFLGKNATYFYLQNPSALYHFSHYENYIIAHGGYGCYIDNKKEFIKQMKRVTSKKFRHFPVLLNVIVEDAGFVNFDAEKCMQ
ncbi:acyl-CoA synthetase, putative [Plasmodium ovale]|uniref:Acyl-CoA synthetase, putative n=1 Tax=Plasmodium ovale TaxID=36330 RepID=A0A1D3TJE9_PLAOA|nr:acyl-CoA synthetase, putative [Plasmodium ovale]